MNYRLLIVDDDKEFLDILHRYLKSFSFDIYMANNVKTALSILHKKDIHLILSDVEMPGMSGLDFLKELRNNKKYRHIPFLLMSGKRISEIDIIEGYQSGSDDYIVKPFSMQVLVAKIKNLLNRIYPLKNNILNHKGIFINLETRQAIVGKEKIKLTKKEFELLEILIKNKGKILSYDDILTSIWSDKYSDPHTIETHISSLRGKLKKKGKLIKNVSGVGYIIE
jgi:DNA-binding response OmpR family regulator